MIYWLGTGGGDNLRRDLKEIVALAEQNETQIGISYLDSLRTKRDAVSLVYRSERQLGFLSCSLLAGGYNRVDWWLGSSVYVLRQLMQKAIGLRKGECITQITVPETKLELQVLLRLMGFKCTSIEKDYFTKFESNAQGQEIPNKIDGYLFAKQPEPKLEGEK